MTFDVRRWLVVVVALVAVGCGSETAPSGGVDAGAPDVSSADGDASSDATVDVLADATLDASSDGGAGDTGCLENCAELGASVTFGTDSVDLERAHYGLSSPEQSSSGEWEIYVELYAGGADGCPTQDSPTPNQTLIVAGITVPTDTPLPVYDVSATLLDFEGRLTTEPVARAVDPVARELNATVCTDCIGDDPDGRVSFVLDAPFGPGNSAAGQVVATHCASLDAR